MDKIVAAILLVIIAIASAIAVTQLINKQWVNATRNYSIDASGSSATLDSEGNATFQIVLRNTGTVTANVKEIDIIDPPDQVYVTFANGTAALTCIKCNPETATGTVSFSNPDKVKIGAGWLALPPGESASMTFQAGSAGNAVSVGDVYIATIYSYSEGQVLTFRLVVQSA